MKMTEFVTDKATNKSHSENRKCKAGKLRESKMIFDESSCLATVMIIVPLGSTPTPSDDSFYQNESRRMQSINEHRLCS
jgi:hypothetical protein